MKTLLLHISSILEFVYIVIIAKSLSKQSFVPNFKDIVGGFIITCTYIFVPENNSVILWIAGQLFYLIYVASMTKDSILNRINLYCISYGIAILLNLFMFTVISLFLSQDVWYVPMLGNIGCLFLSIFLFRFTICKQLYEFLCHARMPYKLLMLNSYILLTVLLLFYKINAGDFYTNLIYWLTISFVLLFANICILYYDHQLFQKQQEVISYQKNLPIYQALVDSIRANQHEFSNRIQYIQKLPYFCKDYDSLCKSLMKTSNSYCKPLQHYALLQIDMPLLAATLYALSSQAEQRGIHIVFNIGAFHLVSHAPEYQLTDFISILIHNAIEASKEGDKLYVQVNTHQDRLQFEIRNPVLRKYSSSEISRFFHKGYTTKNPRDKTTDTPHGYGLYLLLENITKLNGSIGAECIVHKNNFWIIFSLEV
ncbi:MAG: hypothetical protein HDT30_04435 [Clostridiales bacterium]|nr:hypothetical protein [Clostridiales bacterium]